MSVLANLLSAVFFSISAVLWLKGASLQIPRIQALGLASMSGDADQAFMEGLRKSARLNQWAASSAAIGAAFQALSALPAVWLAVGGSS